MRFPRSLMQGYLCLQSGEKFYLCIQQSAASAFEECGGKWPRGQDRGVCADMLHGYCLGYRHWHLYICVHWCVEQQVLWVLLWLFQSVVLFFFVWSLLTSQLVCCWLCRKYFQYRSWLVICATDVSGHVTCDSGGSFNMSLNQKLRSCVHVTCAFFAQCRPSTVP